MIVVFKGHKKWTMKTGDPIAQAIATGHQEPKVKWIITDGNEVDNCEDGEFGVEINGVPYFYYKYPVPDPSNPSSVTYREIEKREFGDTINVDHFLPFRAQERSKWGR